MNNNWGYFNDNGSQYVITTPNTPRHWQNYIWNSRFLSIVSHLAQGSGLKQEPDGSRTNLVTGRMVYIIDQDTKEFWTANGMPVHKNYEDFKCTHGFGFTDISLKYSDIRSSYRIFVPRNETCEIWTITLKNEGDTTRNISLIPYFSTSIHGTHEGSFPAAYADFNNEIQGIMGSNVIRFGSHFAHDTVGKTDDGYFVMDSKVDGYDCARRKFIGEYDTELAPLAVQNGGCTNSKCEFEQIAFVLQSNITLEPGQSVCVNAIAGVSGDVAEINAIKAKYFNGDAIENELKAVTEKFTSEIDTINITAPDKDLEMFFNTWLKHQLNFNSVFARVYFNGFRDLCQDAENYAIINLEHARQRFMKVLTYQYGSGYAPRAWGGGEVIDQDYSDSPVWLVFTTKSIINEDGNTDFLKVELPYLDDAPASVYDHVKRSVNYLWNDRGAHGLSKIHSGDWNDVMNGVGNKGKGESVWLSMALYKALDDFAYIADAIGNTDDAKCCRERMTELKANIDNYAWDGEYYIRGYTDNGVKVGSKESVTGKMFLTPQAWAAISGVNTEDKGLKALESVDKYLECDIGIATLGGLFEGFREDIGFISCIRPGENLNGGIYIHANMFKIVADCIMNRNDDAYRTIQKLMPYSDSRNIGCAEPYVLSNSYFGPGSDYRYGEAGASWITGSCGWFVKAVVNYMFGINTSLDGIKLEPHLPSEWTNCSIKRPYRNAIYNINYVKNKGVLGTDIGMIIVNGVEYKSTTLPYSDGMEYNVTVELVDR